jgi:hypothetical protein
MCVNTVMVFLQKVKSTGNKKARMLIRTRATEKEMWSSGYKLAQMINQTLS